MPHESAIDIHAPLAADSVPPRVKPSNYPEPFASRMAGRVKHPLGDLFGLKTFGVNRTILRPGAVSSLHHRHSLQDELVYVLSGRPTLFVDGAVHELAAGMVAGFPANGPAHHLENRTEDDCVILEIGDRTSGDAVSYPDDDLVATATENEGWRFVHKNGSPYA